MSSAHDAEHQEIFRLVNTLGDAVGSGDRAEVGKQLDALIAYVAGHFAAEEANFVKYGYPAYVGHKAEHDKLVATCLDLQKKFHAGEAEITGDTAGFVVGWLTDHIPIYRQEIRAVPQREGRRREISLRRGRGAGCCSIAAAIFSRSARALLFWAAFIFSVR